METNWNIIQLKRKPNNDLVFEVTYVMNFKLEKKGDRHIGIVTLHGDPESPDFIPYEDLTKEIVLGWVQSELGQDEIDRIESEMQTRLQERIDREKNPPFKTGVPWEKRNLGLDI